MAASPTIEEWVVDHVSRNPLAKTKGEIKKNREIYERKIAAATNRHFKGRQPKVCGGDIRALAFKVINKSAKYNPPKLHDFYAEGRQYLETADDELDEPSSVPHTKEIKYEDESQNLRASRGGQSTGSEQKRRAAIHPREHHTRRVTAITGALPSRSSLSATPRPSDQAKIETRMDTGQGLFISQKWLRHIHEMGRLDNRTLECRLGNLNQEILNVAVDLDSALPDFDLEGLSIAWQKKRLALGQADSREKQLAVIKQETDLVVAFQVFFGRMTQEWIFDNSFPSFDLTTAKNDALVANLLDRKGMILRRSPGLQATADLCLQDAMALQPVVKALLKDMYHEMTSTELFQNEILPRRIHHLTLRAMDLLHKGTGGEDARQGVDCELSWEMIEKSIQQLFQEALSFCIELRRRESATRFRWPDEGEAFNSRSMKAQNVAKPQGAGISVAIAVSPMLVSEQDSWTLGKALVHISGGSVS